MQVHYNFIYGMTYTTQVFFLLFTYALLQEIIS